MLASNTCAVAIRETYKITYLREEKEKKKKLLTQSRKSQLPQIAHISALTRRLFTSSAFAVAIDTAKCV
jgi:hypothetical protein